MRAAVPSVTLYRYQTNLIQMQTAVLLMVRLFFSGTADPAWFRKRFGGESGSFGKSVRFADHLGVIKNGKWKT